VPPVEEGPGRIHPRDATWASEHPAVEAESGNAEPSARHQETIIDIIGAPLHAERAVDSQSQPIPPHDEDQSSLFTFAKDDIAPGQSVIFSTFLLQLLSLSLASTGTD
jgi:hypothetical protein